jgi:hypothetical protein
LCLHVSQNDKQGLGEQGFLESVDGTDQKGQMPGVTRKVSTTCRGIAWLSPALASQMAPHGIEVSAPGRLLRWKARSRWIDLCTNGSTESVTQMSRAHQARDAVDRMTYRTSAISCTASFTSFSLTSFSISSLEMKGRHAFAARRSGFPRAERLTKSSDGMRL